MNSSIKVAYKIVPKIVYNNFIVPSMSYCGSKIDISYGHIQLIPEKFLRESFFYKNLETDKNKFKLIEVDLDKSKSIKLGRFNGLYYPITCKGLYIGINIISIIDMDEYDFVN
jgi:hypothetical protein